jgi:hypothetical protein
MNSNEVMKTTKRFTFLAYIHSSGRLPLHEPGIAKTGVCPACVVPNRLPRIALEIGVCRRSMIDPLLFNHLIAVVVDLNVHKNYRKETAASWQKMELALPLIPQAASTFR